MFTKLRNKITTLLSTIVLVTAIGLMSSYSYAEGVDELPNLIGFESRHVPCYAAEDLEKMAQHFGVQPLFPTISTIVNNDGPTDVMAVVWISETNGTMIITEIYDRHFCVQTMTTVQ